MTIVKTSGVPSALTSASGGSLRAAAQAATAMIAYFDAEGRYVWANPAGLERMGKTLEQVRGKLFADVASAQ